jgi:hypothetical protein
MALLIQGVTAVGGSETADGALILAEGRRLMEEEDYARAEQVLRKVVQAHPQLTEARFLLGLALAKKGDWSASRDELEEVVSLQPNEVCAIVELAGTEYKLGNTQEAIQYLRRALELDPANAYARHFLATLLYLESQKTEALHNWNLVQAPRVGQIQYRVSSKVDPQLLQQLFDFNEREILRKEQAFNVWWKQERFHLGPPFQWHLTPHSAGEWDLEIVLPPRSPLSAPKQVLLQNAVRVPVYREMSLQYPLTLTSGRQIQGAVRWDSPQKRLYGAVRFPFFLSSSDALGFGFEWRDEKWKDVSSGAELPYETRQVSVDYEYLFGGRRSLTIHGGFDHQLLSVESVPNDLLENTYFLRLGLEWNQRMGLNPADSLRLDWRASFLSLSGLGETRDQARQVSSRAGLVWEFGDSSRTRFNVSFGAGYSADGLPLSDFFILGVGQDNRLPLRAHPTVGNGFKGNSPMGRHYLLGNLELSHPLVAWKALEIKGLIFSDTGAVYETPFGESEGCCYQDVGLGFRFAAFGSGILEVLFGFDLRDSSSNVWIGLAR